MTSPRLAAVLALAITVALAVNATAPAAAVDSTGLVPIMDMGQATYLGFGGGLYENGGNDPPADHAAAGDARAAELGPIDGSGNPSPGGKIVLLSIGMSNTTQEFCSANSALPCTSWSFMGQAAADARVNHTTLAIVNGAAGGQSAATWDSPADANYDRVRDTRLVPAGLTEQQVQVAWVKVANPGPTVALPSPSSDAYTLEAQMGAITRSLKVRYPNVKQVFFSSRIYAGYATTTLNPEPYAYQSGFAVKWVVQAQIDQRRNGGVVVDTRAGDLSDTLAPWLAWGPYLWADGLTPRSDDLVWLRSDLAADGIHPAMTGQQKVGTMLLDFFLNSPFTMCWFQTDANADGVSDVCAPCPDQTDSDGDGLPDACDPCPTQIDCDGDGCTDGEEAGVDERLGGRRSAANAWDFYDVNADKTVNIFGDIIPVAEAFGAAPGPPYVAAYDRSAPPSSDQEPDPSRREPWDLGPPDGAVNVFADILGAATQFGHTCAAPP